MTVSESPACLAPIPFVLPKYSFRDTPVNLVVVELFPFPPSVASLRPVPPRQRSSIFLALIDLDET